MTETVPCRICGWTGPEATIRRQADAWQIHFQLHEMRGETP